MTITVVVAAIGFSLTGAHPRPAGASASGPSPSHTSAPGEANCTACHSDFPVNSGTGSVIITGLPANYRPGQTVTLTATVNQADAVVYGFQLTTIDSAGNSVGNYSIPAANPAILRLQSGIVGMSERLYISHTVSGITPTQFGTKSWTFGWTAPSRRAGKVSFHAAGNAANSDGGTGGDFIYTTSAATLSGSAISNFDSDVRSDVAVWRGSTGVWYALNSTDGTFQALQFGSAGDEIVPGDYDGDGKTDFAVWRPSTGVWYIYKSTGGVVISQFGLSGDIPVPGDYDGDLKNDLAVWRPSTGVWYVLRSSDGTYDIRQFGLATDLTAQGDFDADGKTDVAVWRPETGVWYVWNSSDNSFAIFAFGSTGDKPVQGDYDSDGKTDAAVFRPSTGVWYLLRSRDGFAAGQFGVATDLPAPADYDGDGRTDVAVYRDGVWYILKSDGSGFSVVSFGLAGDVPVAAGYINN